VGGIQGGSSTGRAHGCGVTLLAHRGLYLEVGVLLRQIFEPSVKRVAITFVLCPLSISLSAKCLATEI
jgi:hypothetical protein